MELLKKINNNFAVARDSMGQFVIVSGRGIGFEKMPCKIHDMSKITRTYYDVDDRYMNLIQQIPEDIIQLSTKIVDFASMQLQTKLNPNLFFTLADHIHFAIARARKGIQFNFGMTYEMRYAHPEEMKIGEKVVTLINKKFQVNLSSDESAVLAMHILEAENFTSREVKIVDFDKILEQITKILHSELNITLDKDGFSYCRFVSHVQYLLQRKELSNEIASDNKKLYKAMIEEFPYTYTCVEKIKEYFVQKMDWLISDEEMLYLMLHINRLCNNEDCNH